jgi:hypothetical protein
MKTSNYIFGVHMGNSIDPDFPEVSYIALINDKRWNDTGYLDSNLHLIDLDPKVLNGLINGGVDVSVEIAEAMWMVKDQTKSKQDIINDMVREGFIYDSRIDELITW